MARGELFLEVRCEEIPARMLRPGLRELGTRLFEELMTRGLGPREMVTGLTPRRLILTAKGIPESEPDREEQLLGPPVKVAFDAVGRPTRALLGFARKSGVEPERLQRITNARGEYLSATRTVRGRPTPEVLSELIPDLLLRLKWPKTMRWGAGEGPWVRPVPGLVVLYAGEVVPCAFLGVVAGDRTCGHPILSPRSFKVSGGAGYQRAMRQRGLVVAYRERRDLLSEGLRRAAADCGGEWVPDKPLLDRLTAMCEIPGVVAGSFDTGFLSLPREVLTTALRDHQSAFTVERDGDLLPAFLTVMDRADDPNGCVRSGNEWVVAARLADARFFHDEDRKVSLTERRQRLAQLTFHERLGSYADKTERLVALAEGLTEQLGWTAERDAARRAAGLLKADLDTEMVREFTSLQGIVGGLYARSDGASEAVWRAIYEQYLPAAGDDPIPSGPVGRVVGLVDRIDTLVGLFGVGLAPSGSKDPFGLRRAAQGAVRIVLEGGMAVDLERLATDAIRLYGDRLDAGPEELINRLRPFVHDRIRHLLARQGYAYDEVAAALTADSDDLPDLAARVDALHRVRDEPRFLAVVLAAKRIANILKDAAEVPLEPGELVEPAAISLHEAAIELRREVDEAAAEKAYERCFRGVARLADVLDRFFVEVLVMDEDPDLRRNRIALLQSIDRDLSRIAHLTEMVVDRTEHRARAAESIPH